MKRQNNRISFKQPSANFASKKILLKSAAIFLSTENSLLNAFKFYDNKSKSRNFLFLAKHDALKLMLFL
jgi:hypothetical protein